MNHNFNISSPQSSSNNTLFLGDLSSFVDEGTILRAFERFGNISHVRVKRSADGSNKPLCYGFIEFHDYMSASEAQREMDGFILEGRKLIVRWATNCGSDGSRRARKSRVQALVSFISHPKDGHLNLITEHHLREVFQSFGYVTDCVVKKSSVDQTGKQSGYGFVHFEESENGISTAMNVIDRVKRYSVGSAMYDCRMSDNLHKYLHEMRHMSDWISTLDISREQSVPGNKLSSGGSQLSDAEKISGAGATVPSSLFSVSSQSQSIPNLGQIHDHRNASLSREGLGNDDSGFYEGCREYLTSVSMFGSFGTIGHNNNNSHVQDLVSKISPHNSTEVDQKFVPQQFSAIESSPVDNTMPSSGDSSQYGRSHSSLFGWYQEDPGEMSELLREINKRD